MAWRPHPAEWAALLLICEVALLTVVGAAHRGWDGSGIGALAFVFYGACGLIFNYLSFIDVDTWRRVHKMSCVAVHSGVRAFLYQATWPWFGVLLLLGGECRDLLDAASLLVGLLLGMFTLLCVRHDDYRLQPHPPWLHDQVNDSPCWWASRSLFCLTLPGSFVVAALQRLHFAADRTLKDCPIDVAVFSLPWLKEVRNYFADAPIFLALIYWGLALIMPRYGLLAGTVKGSVLEALLHFVVLVMLLYPSTESWFIIMSLQQPIWFALLLAVPVVEILALLKEIAQRRRLRAKLAAALGCGAAGCFCYCCRRRRESRLLLPTETAPSPAPAEPPVDPALRPLRSDRASLWTVDQVLAWLRLLGLERYQAAFRTNAVNGAVLLSLGEAEFTHDLHVSNAHKASLVAALDMLMPGRTGRPQRRILFGNWGWGTQDVCQWLDFLGLTAMQGAFTRAGVHGALLFAGFAEGLIEDGRESGAGNAVASLLRSAAEEALRARGWRPGFRASEAREAALALLRTSVHCALASAEPAYEAGVPAAKMRRQGTVAGGGRSASCASCCRSVCRLAHGALRGLPLLRRTFRCFAYDGRSVAFWGAARAREWLERRVELPRDLAETLEGFGAHGALLLHEGFVSLVTVAFPDKVTPTLARRLQAELAVLRRAEGADMVGVALNTGLVPSAPPPITSTALAAALPAGPVASAPAPPASAGRSEATTAEARDSGATCCICWAQPPECACIPCGHRAVCNDCASKVVALRPKICPICRAPFQQVVRIFDG